MLITYCAIDRLSRAGFKNVLLGYLNLRLLRIGNAAVHLFPNRGADLPIPGFLKNALFKQFCGGADESAVLETSRRLRRKSLRTIFDLVKEGTTTDAITKYERMLAAADEGSAFAIKLSTMVNLRELSQAKRAHVMSKLIDFCTVLSPKNCSLLIDAEESHYQLAINDIAMELMGIVNTVKPVVYNTVQMYRRDSSAMLMGQLNCAQAGGFKYAVKLVRGAYQSFEDKENTDILYSDKSDTDDAYDRAAIEVLTSPSAAVMLATHNEASIERALSCIRCNPFCIENTSFAQLYGLGDYISDELAARSLPVYKYTPFGSIKDAIPYLIRRAEENQATHGLIERERQIYKQVLCKKLGKLVP